MNVLRDLGMNPVTIGARPTVPGMGSGLNVEDAAAFDSYVQRKAAEIGLDLDNLPPPAPRGARGAPGEAPTDPMAPADWNPRFVNGRREAGFEFLQTERRRYIMMREWAEFMRGPGHVHREPHGGHRQHRADGESVRGAPVQVRGASQPSGRRSAAGDQPPEPELNPQPICGQIIGNLYNDDLILSVAHQFQAHDDTVNHHPAL